MLKYRFPKSCKDQMCLLLVDIGDNVGISMLKIIFIGMRENLSIILCFFVLTVVTAN